MHVIPAIFVLFLISIEAMGGREAPLWIPYDDGRGFELSGELGIVLEDDLLDHDDGSLKLLTERIMDFTGYEPVLQSDELNRLRCVFILSMAGPVANDKVSYRIKVDPNWIRIDANGSAGAAAGIMALAEILTWDSEVLTRSEVHAWEEHQRPNVICRWIYSVPTSEVTGNVLGAAIK